MHNPLHSALYEQEIFNVLKYKPKKTMNLWKSSEAEIDHSESAFICTVNSETKHIIVTPC